MKLVDAIAQAARGCQLPGCDHGAHAGPMFLHARCHPRAALSVSVDPTRRELLIACAVCKRPVATIEP
jgi:hypothetical protein